MRLSKDQLLHQGVWSRSEERRVGKEWRSRRAAACFQAEDGIRDTSVTGVQTCALPICRAPAPPIRNKTTHSSRSSGSVQFVRPGAVSCADLDREVPPCYTTTDEVEQGPTPPPRGLVEIGRASCRERVEEQEGGCVFSSRRRHTRYIGDWSSDVCSSDLQGSSSSNKE